MNSWKMLKAIPVDEKLRKTTNLWVETVEIMNSINDKYKRKLSHVVKILVCRLT